MAVVATGFIDVYGPQGRYQFYVSKLEPAGVGVLRLAFEQMAEKQTHSPFIIICHSSRNRNLFFSPFISISVLRSQSSLRLIVLRFLSNARLPRPSSETVPGSGIGSIKMLSSETRTISVSSYRISRMFPPLKVTGPIG